MMVNDLIIILLIIIILLLNFDNKENFEVEDNLIKVRGASSLNGDKSDNTMIVDISDPFIDRNSPGPGLNNNENLYDLSSEDQTDVLNRRGLSAQGVLSISDKQKKIDEQQKYLDNKNQIYKQQLMNDNLETTYFYNSLVDQNKITENAYDVINSIDNIDYSQPKEFGIDKCRRTCDGVCVESGYNGIGSCVPVQKTNWGTLYKNPAFTYGLEVPYYNKNNQSP